MRNINDKLKLALKFVVAVIVILLIILTILLVTKESNSNNGDNIQNGKPIEENNNTADEAKEEILDITALNEKDAFQILDILLEKYGEPRPQGLIAIIKELKEESPKFETATWTDIKHGYNFAFNFWTDGSLGREDTFYITGYKARGNSVDEVFNLVKVPRDSEDFVVNVTDLGGAVFHVGITPKKVAETEPPKEIEEEEELSKEEILEILKTNADKKWSNDVARAKLEYDKQVEAFQWVNEQTKYLDLMDLSKEEWGDDYLMVKWKYEKLVEAHEATL